MRTSPLWAVLALLLAPTSDDPHEITFGVPRGARIEKTFEGRIELSLEEQSVTVDGEDLLKGQDLDLRLTWKGDLVFVDEYREVGPERPTKLAREFRTLRASELVRVEVAGQDHAQTRERESDLEGRSVLFTWDEDDEEYAREYEGEERGHRSLLADLVADCDLLSFLPSEAVAEGDSWELDARHFYLLTNMGGNLRIQSGEREHDEDEDRHAQFRDNLEGELVATFEGLREEDDVRVAVIALRAEVSTHATQDDEGEDEVSVETRFRRDSECEGEILWDLEGGRPHSFRIAGATRVDRVQTASGIRGPDGQGRVRVERVVLAGEAVFAGSWRALD